MKPDYSPNVVDVDALEKIRLHETAETERVRIKESETTRREDIAKRDTNGYIWTRIVAAVCALAATIAVCVTVSDVVSAAHPRPVPPPEPKPLVVPVVEAQCEDEFFKIDGDHTHAACTHSKQVSSIRKLNGQEVFYCQCQGAPLPEHGIVPPATSASAPTASASAGH